MLKQCNNRETSNKIDTLLLKINIETKRTLSLKKNAQTVAFLLLKYPLNGEQSVFIWIKRTEFI